MDSDSDSSFDGFTARNIRLAEQKLAAMRRNKSSVADSDSSSGSDDDESDIDVVQSSDDSSGDDTNITDSDSDDNNINNNNPPAGWSKVRDIHANPVPVDQFTHPSGPNHHLPPTAKPVDFFMLFWTDDTGASIFETFARETNRYAQQRIAAAGRPDKLWKPTTPAEMRAFVAINIHFGLKEMPRLQNYWVLDKQLDCEWMKDIMSQQRFYKLNQYFHVRDNSNMPARGQPGHDSLFKLRPIIELLTVGKCTIPNVKLVLMKG